MKKLSEHINAISDDFQSTFPFVNENQLANVLRGEHFFAEVSSIIKKYLGNVEVSFKQVNEIKGKHGIYEINIAKL